jgi:prevent-host-death family protein
LAPRGVTTIPQRELRNHIGEYLTRASEGESFLVTTNGKPMARVEPVTPTRKRYARDPEYPATRQGGWDEIPRFVGKEPSQVTIDFLREERI